MADTRELGIVKHKIQGYLLKNFSDDEEEKVIIALVDIAAGYLKLKRKYRLEKYQN